MEFDSLQLIDNLSVTVNVPEIQSREGYTFYQIGMIYQLDGCRLLKNSKHGDLEHFWIDLNKLSDSECSKMLWEYRMRHSMKG